MLVANLKKSFHQKKKKFEKNFKNNSGNFSSVEISENCQKLSVEMSAEPTHRYEKVRQS